LLYRSRWLPLMSISERSLTIMTSKLVDYRLRESPPDLMINISVPGVGLFDLDQVDVCLRYGEEAARRHGAELARLRDAPAPAGLARWCHSARRRWQTILGH
jgi:hypothetical protein